MLKKFEEYLVKPQLDAPGNNNIWTDEYVSKGMLESHLDRDGDGASRPFAFMDKSVEWIYSIAPPEKYKNVLDLGCGPGLYCERFYDKGYNVTGVDWSERSIEYAKDHAVSTGRKIDYVLKNYLTMDYENVFDIAVIISYDFCVLSKNDRRLLLEKIYKALRPGGKFIFDVTTTKLLSTEESRKWDYHPNGCFSSEKPHICFNLYYCYPEDETNLTQTIILSDGDCDCFHIWHHYFTEEKLLAELNAAGFSDDKLYGDVAGKSYIKDDDFITVAATKTNL
ncbi:MAG: class I SAM-dependent methyltransferase [Oscillospiraceae bacterium]|nr:class I SAM-dependent methyltransferase [Oscillospiraceae bacterium]